jgi:hypothetical protein
MRSLFALACLALCTPFLRAHGPLESSLGIFQSNEGYELIAELTLPSASRLLPPEAAKTFSAASFADHHKALAAAIGQVCNLLDPDGQPIPSSRDLVSMNRHGEVRVVRLYPATARAASVRFDLLAALPAGQFCNVADNRTQPAGQHILKRDQPLYSLTPAAKPQP